MPAFEVVPPEFYGGTDATDHMIKWGMADHIEDVKKAYPGCRVGELDEFF